MAKKTTKRKKAPATPKVQTPREMADELRERALKCNSYRYRPEVRRAIARNPAVLKTVLEAEHLAAEFLAMADKIEADFGHLSDAEFAALNAATEEWARNNPEKAAEIQREAGNRVDAVVDTYQKGAF